MHLKMDMEMMDVGGAKMAVPVDSGDYRGVLQINGTTEAILRLLEQDTDEDRIVSALSEKYDAPQERIRQSVRKVLDILRQEELLAE